MDDTPRRLWRQLVLDWRVWLVIIACLAIAIVEWLLGYD